jgi:membrane-associated phospholipid phosphatase
LLNNFFSIFPDIIWHNITLLGDGAILLFILSFFILVKPQVFASIIASVPCAALLSFGFKEYFMMPRPASVLDENLFNVIGYHITYPHSTPSGHSITVFLATTAILYTLLPKDKNKSHHLTIVIFYLLCLMIAASRIAVGAHWPIDIIIGAICGIIAGITGVFIAKKYRRWWQIIFVEHSWGKLLFACFFILQVAMYYKNIHPADSSIFIVWLSYIISIFVVLFLLGEVLKNKYSLK